jgi:NADPH:quinone reductase-like Zn-dependent oxidoreductase
MKAAIVTRYGPPDVVRIADVAKPTVRSGDVLVRVHATTVNRTDCGYRAANPFFIRLFSGLARPRVNPRNRVRGRGGGGRRAGPLG